MKSPKRDKGPTTEMIWLIDKADSCDKYKQDKRNIVSRRAETNRDLNIGQLVFIKFRNSKVF